MANLILNRRRLLGLGALGAASVTLAGCDAFDGMLKVGQPLRSALEKGNELSYGAQRLIVQNALAREYSTSEIRQGQRPNGSTDPSTAEYLALKANNFADYRLKVTGLVETEVSYSLNELRNMPARSQITRHDCVEGWSCIAKWTGTPLSGLLAAAVPKPEAKFAVYHCYDNIERGLSGDILYYESSDLIDARHPQSILAYGLNDEVLPVANGAPVRLRIERALGYKQPKYLHTVELVADLAKFGNGRGGYWEDRGYDWYGGI
ncbi:MAG: molybdopterin oxidoreductase [Devosia sp.]|nr:molybdopterin oxidoreductase [Devosia sp.]